MPERATDPVEKKSKNPFDVPKGRWKVYAALTMLALIAAIVGIALGVDVLAIIGLMAAMFLGIGIVYSYMNEEGL